MLELHVDVPLRGAGVAPPPQGSSFDWAICPRKKTTLAFRLGVIGFMLHVTVKARLPTSNFTERFYRRVRIYGEFLSTCKDLELPSFATVQTFRTFWEGQKRITIS